MNKLVVFLISFLMLSAMLTPAFAEKSKVTGSFVSIDEQTKSVNEEPAPKKMVYYSSSAGSSRSDSSDKEVNPEEYDYYFARGENIVVEEPEEETIVHDMDTETEPEIEECVPEKEKMEITEGFSEKPKNPFLTGENIFTLFG